MLRRLAKLSPWQESNLQMPGIPGASTISPHDEPPQPAQNPTHRIAGQDLRDCPTSSLIRFRDAVTF